MKKKYIKPEFEIAVFDEFDILRTSGLDIDMNSLTFDENGYLMIDGSASNQ